MNEYRQALENILSDSVQVDELTFVLYTVYKRDLDKLMELVEKEDGKWKD